jgi:hypothetical protein
MSDGMGRLRRGCLVVALLTGLTVWPDRAADLTSGYAWKPLKIGGGGWVVGLDISPTEKGLMYCRTDVSGAYRWVPETGSWKRIVTSDSMPAAYVGYGRYSGVDSVVSAPHDPNIAYMAFTGDAKSGQIFRSTDRGEHWTATRFDQCGVRMEPNGEGRQRGERLAVDPANSDVVYFASVANGLWTTDDGGKTWRKVDAVPAGVPPQGVTTIVFDPQSGTRADAAGVKKTRTIYASVEKVGIFQSTDAGATWADIGGKGPGDAVEPRAKALGPDGAYYVAFSKDDRDGRIPGSIWKFSRDGHWTDITPPAEIGGGSQSYAGLAADATDSRHLAVIVSGGKLFDSADGGATWTPHGFSLHSSTIQWLGHQDNHWLSVGAIAFDPFAPGKLWFAEGFGVWWADDLKSPDIAWQAASDGIEEACARDVIAPPGGAPVGATMDLGAFHFSDPDSYTAQRSQPTMSATWALDWCAKDPKFIAGIFRGVLEFMPHFKASGFSTDGGVTWQRFAALDTGRLPADLDYGCVAVSAQDPANIVWLPATGKLPYYTVDQGATWQQAAVDTPTDMQLKNPYMAQKPLCADRVLPRTFYLYTALGGLLRSTDGGATFHVVGNPTPTGRWEGALKSVPGHAGDLWLAEGPGGGLRHSTDGGATWTVVAALEQCFNVGLGKPQARDGYPTLYAVGIVNQVEGIYRSTDAGATWDQIGGYPLGIFDRINALDGDKDVFGRVYVALSGSGLAYGAPRNP